MNDFEKYCAILSLPHHVSGTHRPMSNSERAAQFSPFAALSGYGEAVRETARLTDTQRSLAEDAQLDLERTLCRLQALLDAGQVPRITATFFRPDAKKAGGTYVTVRAKLKRIDSVQRELVLYDGQCIPLDLLSELDVPCGTPVEEE